MERYYQKHTKKLFELFLTTTLLSSTAIAAPLTMQKQTGFFRFSFEEVSMPNNIENMGLAGIGYFANITPEIYGGIEGFGSLTGTQGGLFVLGAGAGWRHEFTSHWSSDVGLFLGGGGGRSSLVGGGLMVRPYAGLAYSWQWARLGVYYSYVNFPSGKIQSQQIGLNLDVPCDFYYVSPGWSNYSYSLKEILMPKGTFLDLQRNDFSLILQAYDQQTGTRNVHNQIQDGTIKLVGAELDHYVTNNVFWYVKTAGAFSGVPNGYMDVLGGFGYHWRVARYLALVPQVGAGAGGGGNVDTGGGVLLQPQLGLEVPLSSSFAARVSGGYLWSPKGQMRAYTGTAAIIYHLDLATASTKPIHVADNFTVQGWRVQLFNQLYFHPKRTVRSIDSNINMIALQFDQFFTPNFFFSYQAASAYSGDHAGGYATGMIGPGLQTAGLVNNHVKILAEVLVGAGGGGNLSLGGGSIIEPLVGLHYAFTKSIGLQASYSKIKALRSDLNVPVFNLGLTVDFGTLNHD